MPELAGAGIDAVVFDLDGTLVRLAVDWAAVAADVTEAFAERDIDVAGMGLWAMLDRADETGHRDAIEAVITEYEHAGARASERLAFADTLTDTATQIPVGICSLNAESACRIALATHDLADTIDCVVGRDSVGSHKPDPEGLLHVASTLSVTPERVLFVGDSKRDERTADRAGTRFRYVGDGPTDY